MELFTNITLWIGVIVAVILFFIGMKLAKWLMWSLAILAIILAIWFGVL
jgi:hypothetical protein